MLITVINGPNINFLGIREPEIYGNATYGDLCKIIEEKCSALGIEAEIFQSNHEGEIIDKIQSCYKRADAIIINPGGYTHYSVAILDALKSVNIPYIEVHLSDINEREEFRRVSITGMAAKKIIAGKGIAGYIEAIEELMKNAL